MFGQLQGLVYNHQHILTLAAEHDNRVSFHGNVRQHTTPTTSSWVKRDRYYVSRLVQTKWRTRPSVNCVISNTQTLQGLRPSHISLFLLWILYLNETILVGDPFAPASLYCFLMYYADVLCLAPFYDDTKRRPNTSEVY